jgi:hypothetical protein
MENIARDFLDRLGVDLSVAAQFGGLEDGPDVTEAQKRDAIDVLQRCVKRRKISMSELVAGVSRIDAPEPDLADP